MSTSPNVVPLKATQMLDKTDLPKLVPPIVVNQNNNKKKSNNTVGRGKAGVKLDQPTVHLLKRKINLTKTPDDNNNNNQIVDEDTIPDKKTDSSSETSEEEVEEGVFPKDTTWFPENWRNQTISKLKDGPVYNVFIYWEKVFGLYGVSYKLLNREGQYFWSTSDVVHWLETGICDMSKENLCTKRHKNGKILCGKCDKNEEDKEALNKANH